MTTVAELPAGFADKVLSAQSTFRSVMNAMARPGTVQRIVAAAWKPGAAIPNEIDLSRELGISVGPVRKALDEMESERLISRRQGRGTFVIDQASEECATRFTNLRDATGARIIGEVESCEVAAATASEVTSCAAGSRPRSGRNATRSASVAIAIPVKRAPPTASPKGIPTRK